MMRKRFRTLLLLLLISALTVPAAAAGSEGSIWVRLDTGELPVINGAFSLYQAGSPMGDGYWISEELGGGYVRGDDALSPHLAQWLNDMEHKQGSTVLLDADGNAVFSGLQEGLYLLVQTERTDGFYPIQPFLVQVPGSGKQHVSLYLEPLPMVAGSPPTGQDPTPYIGAAGLVISLLGMILCTKWRTWLW